MLINSISVAQRQPVQKTLMQPSEDKAGPGVLTKSCYRMDIPGVAAINVLGKPDKKDVAFCQKIAGYLKREAETARRAGLEVPYTPIMILKDIKTATVGDYFKALTGNSDIRDILDKKIRPILKEYNECNRNFFSGKLGVKEAEEYNKISLPLIRKAETILPGIELDKLSKERDLNDLIKKYRAEMSINETLMQLPALSYPFGALGAQYNHLYKAVFITPDVHKEDLKLGDYHTILHEYGHSIFGGQEKTKFLEPRAEDFLIDRDIARKNLAIVAYNTSINELFADACAVLTTGNPVYIEKYSKKASSRDFSLDWSLDIWGTKEAAKKYDTDFSDEHIILNPVRSFIWSAVKSGQLTPEQTLKGLVDFTVEENENIKTNIGKNIKERNKSLIDFLSPTID